MPEMNFNNTNNNFDATKFKNTLTGMPVFGAPKVGALRKKIYDAQNRIIGTVGGNRIYDLNGNLWGTIITKTSASGFNKNEIVDRGQVIATIDNHKNIYRKEVSRLKIDSSTTVYLGTIKQNTVVAVLLPIFISLLLVTGVTGTILSGILKGKSDSDYLNSAPILGVYSKSVTPSTSWTQTEDLDIFNKGNLEMAVIAPGQSGDYVFIVKNENAHPINYSVAIKEKDDYGFGLVYKLSAQSVGDSKRYLIGTAGNDGWVEIDGLVTATTRLEPGASQAFILDWLWVLEDNDEQNAIDTNIGSHRYQYGLTLTVSAEFI